MWKVYPACEVLVSSSSWFSIIVGGQASYCAQDLQFAGGKKKSSTKLKKKKKKGGCNV